MSPHIGGGVGSVLGGFFESCQDYKAANSLFCLDYCDTNFKDITKVETKCEGTLSSSLSRETFENEINQTDVVLLHYWNHPLLAKFLSMSRLPQKKLVIWCHNSGLFEPHVLPKYLVDISSKVLFTSGCSYLAHNLRGVAATLPEKFGVVQSTRNLDDFLRIGAGEGDAKPIKNLLYIGTVSGSKMHPESAKIFAELSKQGFSIQVVGGPDHLKLADAVQFHDGEIEVFGEVGDIVPFFRDADLFIYPLRSDHYGTGEQVILEAMASGMPVIAFDNPAERAILEKGGGVLVSNAQEFISSVKRLRSDQTGYFNEMSTVAINRIRSEFNFERMSKTLIDIMSDVAENAHLDVVDHGLLLRARAETDELALYALHSFFDGEDMVNDNIGSLSSLENVVFEKIRLSLKTSDNVAKWCGLSKSTPFHYQQYFPDNVHLKSLCQKISAEYGLVNAL